MFARARTHTLCSVINCFHANKNDYSREVSKDRPPVDRPATHRLTCLACVEKKRASEPPPSDKHGTVPQPSNQTTNRDKKKKTHSHTQSAGKRIAKQQSAYCERVTRISRTCACTHVPNARAGARTPSRLRSCETRARTQACNRLAPPPPPPPTSQFNRKSAHPAAHARGLYYTQTHTHTHLMLLLRHKTHQDNDDDGAAFVHVCRRVFAVKSCPADYSPQTAQPRECGEWLGEHTRTHARRFGFLGGRAPGAFRNQLATHRST